MIIVTVPFKNKIQFSKMETWVKDNLAVVYIKKPIFDIQGTYSKFYFIDEEAALHFVLQFGGEVQKEEKE